MIIFKEKNHDINTVTTYDYNRSPCGSNVNLFGVISLVLLFQDRDTGMGRSFFFNFSRLKW